MLALVKQAVRSISRRNSHVNGAPVYHFLVVHDCSVNDLPTIFICSALCIQWRRTFIYCAEDLMDFLFCVSAEFCTSKFRWPHFGGSGRVWRHANCRVTTYRPPASSHCTGRGICCFGSSLSNCSNISLSGLFFSLSVFPSFLWWWNCCSYRLLSSSLPSPEKKKLKKHQLSSEEYMWKW